MGAAIKLLQRYESTTRFLGVRVDAKDRTIRIGDVTDVLSSYLLDSEGAPKLDRWQVIAADEIEPGHLYGLDLQTYQYVGRFAYYMEDGSPDYADATEGERAFGAWYADANGEVDGDEGYLYQ